MAYTAFDFAKPVGSQTGTQFAASTNTNDVALWYALQHGSLAGWTFSISGGTNDKPTYFLWTGSGAFSTHRVRSTNTWDGGGRLTQQVIEVDNSGSGSAYATVLTKTYTYDGSGNVTATTGGGGVLDWIVQLLGKFASMFSTLSAHIAMTVGAHGIQSMASQQSSSVAITGGTVNNAAIGLSTAAEAVFTRAHELCWDPALYPPPGPIIINWAKGASALQAGVYNITGFQNMPAANLRHVATHALIVPNLNNITFPASVTWGTSGKPSISTECVVQLLAIDPAKIYAIVVWR